MSTLDLQKIEKKFKDDFDTSPHGLPDGYEDWSNYSFALKTWLLQIAKESYLLGRKNPCPCKKDFHNITDCGKTGEFCVDECLENRTDIKTCGCGWNYKTGFRQCKEHKLKKKEGKV